MSADMQKFIFSLVMLGAGIALCIIDTAYGDQGPWLISFAAGAMFGVVKKPVKPVVAVLFLSLLCIGCTAPQVDDSFISLTNKVLDRHDGYITEDTSLTSLEKTAYLEESAACKEYLDALKNKVVTTYP